MTVPYSLQSHISSASLYAAENSSLNQEPNIKFDEENIYFVFHSAPRNAFSGSTCLGALESTLYTS